MRSQGSRPVAGEEGIEVKTNEFPWFSMVSHGGRKVSREGIEVKEGIEVQTIGFPIVSNGFPWRKEGIEVKTIDFPMFSDDLILCGRLPKRAVIHTFLNTHHDTFKMDKNIPVF